MEILNFVEENKTESATLAAAGAALYYFFGKDTKKSKAETETLDKEYHALKEEMKALLPDKTEAKKTGSK